MAVPKRKTSKARRDKRRASNIRMVAPQVIKCPQCHEPNVPHRVCAACGHYKGREVIAVD
jgi:large subunit ribosomal protein L32